MVTEPYDTEEGRETKSQEQDKGDSVRVEDSLLYIFVPWTFLDITSPLGACKKGDDERIGEVTALVGYKFDKGIPEKNPRRVVITEQDTPATDQAVLAVFNVMGTQVNWTAPKFPPASFAGE